MGSQFERFGIDHLEFFFDADREPMTHTRRSLPGSQVWESRISYLGSGLGRRLRRITRNAGSTTIQRPFTNTSASTCLVRREESNRSSLRARSPPLTARFSKAFVAVPQTCSRAWKFRVSIGLRSGSSPTKAGVSWAAGLDIQLRID